MTNKQVKVYKSLSQVYADPEQYNSQFVLKHREDMEFYLRYVKGKKVLYFGSASGQWLNQYAKISQKIIGVEIEPKMVKQSKKNYPKLEVHLGSVLDLNLKEKFDLCIAPYRFFCHFNSQDAAKVFKVASQHLLPGGEFISDIFSPFLPFDNSIQTEPDQAAFEDGTFETIYNQYDRISQICTEVIDDFNTHTGEHTIYELPEYYYYPQQLTDWATAAGFKLVKFMGSFEGEEFIIGSKELIFHFRKKLTSIRR